MRRPLAAATVLVFVTTHAHAAEESVKAPRGGNVLVWQSDHFDEAMRLLSAGVGQSNPQLLARLLSCRIPPGTRVVVTNGGFLSSNVTVTSGPSAGCRGTLANEHLP